MEYFTNKKISPKEYWDKVLSETNLPRCNTKNVYNYSVTMDFIDEIIKNSDYKTFIEVGCGSSGWLPYFAKKYGLLVSGLDYSEVGCRLAEENLRMQNIQYGEIICKDIFELKNNINNKYDIVFSYGVIEHFNTPEELIQIFTSLLNFNGIIITLVPNLNGIYAWLSKIFVKDIYNMHITFTKEELLYVHESAGLKNMKTNYAGNFVFAVIPLIRSNVWLLKHDTIRRKIVLKFIYLIDFVLSKIYVFSKINLPSKFLSPYVISIVKYEHNK